MSDEWIAQPCYCENIKSLPNYVKLNVLEYCIVVAATVVLTNHQYILQQFLYEIETQTLIQPHSLFTPMSRVVVVQDTVQWGICVYRLL